MVTKLEILSISVKTGTHCALVYSQNCMNNKSNFSADFPFLHCTVKYFN